MTQPVDSGGQRRERQGDSSLQKTRAWAGLLVILLGDVAIVLAAILGLASTDHNQSAAILASAFTAVSTMTTAYFGIRAVSNTAQSAVGSAEPPQ
ncbi:hypothetical protein [Streptomyces mexicanus]|jgi:hypothetical protein|uniref:hypothetical protein n=1 Tax=Streptomyces mexicanus TaxID=178566 RepID=UPI000B28A995